MGAMRTRRLLPAAIIALLLVIGSATLWMLRDPEPVFGRRSGPLTEVDTLPNAAHEDSGTLVLRLRAATGLAATLAVRPAAPVPRVADADRPTGAIAPTGVARRPLVLILGGQQRGRGAVALVDSIPGVVLAALDYPYEGNPAPRGLVATLAQVPAIRRAFYDTPPAVSLALDHLLQRPDVDPTRVELVGASFGAPFATIAAARDPRIARLWLAQGGGRPFLLIDASLRRDVPWRIPRFALAGLGTLLISGPRFAPERWIARVAPRPVVFLDSRDDERIPEASREALFSAAAAPKSRIWLDGPHMLGSRPQVIRAVVDSILPQIVGTPATSSTQ
ncbi:MAG: alpha/beta hydrolase [Gemmatimonadota bacterium]|nr:alpha/beta hydrolase [Gemmatimonadota bacterium]MDQ8146821.1 alpha/beta hydrolase [Gemmatimonadota bacterium]MDQ8157188.1 alpha/beta hydrolase [Gemmatimonadota bacterium]